MKAAIWASIALLGLNLAGCAKPPVDIGSTQIGTLSPVLRYGTSADFCASVAYLTEVAERANTRYLAQLGNDPKVVTQTIGGVTRTAKAYGPGSAPYQEAIGGKSDAC